MSGTRVIYVATFGVLAVLAALSVLIFRGSERDGVEAFSRQQLAVVRTIAVGVQLDLQALEDRLRTLNALPSVQALEPPYVGLRVRDAFRGASSGVVRQVVRIAASGERFTWTPEGELLEQGVTVLDPARWEWFSDRSHESRARIDRIWWDASAPAGLQVIALPVWRNAPTGQLPVPPNSFNGVLAFVFDVGTLIGIYAGPAMVESSNGRIALQIDQAPGAIRVDAGGRAGSSVVTAATALSDEGVGREGGDVLAWSRVRTDRAPLTVLIATPDSVATQTARQPGQRQLAIVAALIAFVPVVGWLLLRRERRAEEERRALQMQLAQAQKMDAIGKLAGGVAHDFNNLLTAIIGYVSLIIEDVEPQSPIYHEATQIRRAAESAAALTQKLLAFSRRQVLQPEQIDLGHLVGELVPLLQRLIGEQITVIADAEPNLWLIAADPVQVEQALINLAINARDAMPEGGSLSIALRNAPRPHGERRLDHAVLPGDYVQLVVRDSGIGMDEATRARMFEPFFTTKPKGKGTGLGLSTVYGIVKQSGGYISVSSAPNSGTSIELLLPRSAAHGGAAAPAPARLEASARGTETILLVEDDDVVRELARTALQRHGYHVLAAAGSEDAIRIARDFREPIALLLTDVVMPGMQGPELAVHLRTLRPETRVLFMSGYAAESLTGEMLKDAALLQKPFASAVLTRAVRHVLDRPATVAS